MADERPQLLVIPLADCAPEIGRALWMLENSRKRTRRALADLQPDCVDWTGGLNGHSIGTLLFHIAAIEVDWLNTEVLGGMLDNSVWDHFPYEARDEAGRLTIVRGPASMNTGTV